MKAINKISVYIIIPFLIGSCTDMLNVEPKSVITTESFWQSESDAEGALIGMYVDLRNLATNNLYYFGEARSDVIMMGTVGEGGWSKYYLNTLHPSDAGPDWQGGYTLVNSANLILKYVPDIQFTSEEQKNEILAQAHAMRAFAYFVMTKTWGALPIRTEPTEGTDAETTQIERSSVEEIFTLIKEDLEQALQLFPNDNYPDGRFLWSRPAANALKADVYLWTGKRLNGGQADFSTALESLNEIESSTVSLLPEFADVFDFENKGNEEVLMAVRFDEFEGGNNYFSDMYIIGSAIPTNIEQATRNVIGQIGGGSNNIVVPTPYTKSLLTEEDSRRDASFFEIFTIDDQGNREYYTTIVLKGSGTVFGGERQFKDDIILYRYAEVLLMKAEAKNALGQDSSPEINQVRERAFGENFDDHVFVSGSQEENNEAILEERLRELAFEGKRWWDLIRFGKAIEMLPTLQNKENPEHLLLWPIPNSVLSLENKIEQNPGY